MNRRICSLETEYALASNLLSSGKFQREQLADLLEEAVLEDHQWLPCNSSGRQRLTAPDGSPRVEVREGYFIENGSRFYYDAGHLEWSNPETGSPGEAVVYAHAADLNLARAVHRLKNVLRAQAPECWVMLVKNNIDYQGGKSYGSHENYSLRRYDENGRDFADRLPVDLVPFLVTRSIFTGAGRIGERQVDLQQPAGFQISQRADFIECLCSPDARQRRSLINLRDEPLADERKWRRLHLVVGDSNMSDFATFLKLGTTSLVLDLIEAGVVRGRWALRDPVEDLHRVSRDWRNSRLQLQDGSRVGTLEIQRGYLQLAQEWLAGISASSEGQAILQAWAQTLADLESGGRTSAGGLDWQIKQRDLFERVISSAGTDWEELGYWSSVMARCSAVPLPPRGYDALAWLQRQLPVMQVWGLRRFASKHRLDWRLYGARRRLLNRLREMDFRYHDLDRERGLYYRWESEFSAPSVRPIIAEEASAAQYRPPSGSRAQQRYRVIKTCWRRKIKAELDWDKVMFLAPARVVALPDPFAEEQPELDRVLEPENRSLWAPQLEERYRPQQPEQPRKDGVRRRSAADSEAPETRRPNVKIEIISREEL